MTSLLPPNATKLEQAIEAATTTLDSLFTDIRQVWSPEDCPEGMLPWLAWALSLDSWSPDWPLYIKRARVRWAIDIAKRKGTAESVRSVVESFGGAVALREWWQEGGSGQPYTFDLVITLNSMNGKPATAAFIDSVIAEVSRTKPARAHFSFSQGFSASSAVGLTAHARPVTYSRLELSA